MYNQHASLPTPSGVQRGWSAPRPWASDGRTAFTPKHRKLEMQSYEPFMKRSFPVVSLTLDRTGKISVNSTLSNVYIKVPESSVSVPAILAEIGKKTSTDPEELTVLDSKLLPVTDDKGKCNCNNYMYYAQPDSPHLPLPFLIRFYHIRHGLL